MTQSDSRIPIVYYHSVGVKNPLWTRNFLTLELSLFEDQIKYFSRRFDVISLAEYFDIRKGLQNPVKNPIVITFDDGYLDNWIWAFPIIKKYGVRATIFVSPEFTDPRPVVRPNLEDVWEGRANFDEITQWGFLSWEEMKLMERSGIVDIQSHTMSHTKFFTSDALTGFHAGNEGFYAACNLFPERKPYYIVDPGFNEILKPGHPLFEERSAIIARKVEISGDFTNRCIEALKDYDFNHYAFSTAMEKISSLYRLFKERDELITGIESEVVRRERVNYDICYSKKIIEKELSKNVDFLCWPHGDNSPEAIEISFACGYKGVAAGNSIVPEDDCRFIPARIGTSMFMNSRYMTLCRARYKINRYLKKFPYRQIDSVYHKIRYK